MRGGVEQKKEQKKEGLLEAAYQLFLEKGVNKTSVDEIVKKANVAKGTFYLYFHDKTQLLQQLTYRISARVLSEAYEYAEEHKTGVFVEDIILMVDYIVEYFKRSRLTLRLLERNFSWPMIEKQLDLREDPLWDKLVTAIESSSLAVGCTEDVLYKRVFLVVELIGSTCFATMIENKCFTTWCVRCLRNVKRINFVKSSCFVKSY